MYRQSHSPPGRLRLRLNQLRHDPVQLGRIAALMRDIDGVLSVEPSPITGGVLIHYDAAKGLTRQFWNDVESFLSEHKLNAAARAAPYQTVAVGAGPGRAIAEGVIETLVGKLVERSALALVAALL